MDTLQTPLLLVPSPPQPLDVHIQLPRPNDNLFERLIRDPQAPHRPMRERQCAEMLRSVLVSCPILARCVFEWLAQHAGISGITLDQLHWTMETEQSIGSKRDDLRIEAWTTGDEDPRRIVLWTVEIKVAAPLHESSLQLVDTELQTTDHDEPVIVSQLVNYDHWLRDQTADHKAGFVLALRDMSAHLPTGLNQPWHCFTWTTLALQMEQVLATDDLPKTERPFAEHMLGFIRHRLWDTTDMMNSRLELDDVALLRALAAMGPACSRKLKHLVDQFQQVFEETGVGFLKINCTSSFFDRSDVVQYSAAASCSSDNSWLSVNAGIVADHVRVWVTVGNPKAKKTKQAVCSLLRDHQTSLRNRNPDWVIADTEGKGNPSRVWGHADAQLAKPLLSVLAQEDWQTPLIDFVRGALDDLKELGILDRLVKIGATKDES